MDDIDYNDDVIGNSYVEYFSNTTNTLKKSNVKTVIHETGQYELVKSENNGFDTNLNQYFADDNIDGIDELGSLIELVLNRSWGKEWGLFGPDFKSNTNAENLVLPQITYDDHERVVSQKTSVKPNLMTTYSEKDGQGKLTGESINIYRQLFDVMVEFNIYGKDSLSTRTLIRKFEKMLLTYSKLFKKKGISEIIFLKAMSGKQSENFDKELNVNMKSLLYLVKIERITEVKVSELNKLEIEAFKNLEPILI